MALHIIYMNFQVVHFADNFQEFVTLNVVYEEIFKLSFIREDVTFCFCYLFCFHACLVHVTQHDFLLQSDSFLKELANAN